MLPSAIATDCLAIGSSLQRSFLARCSSRKLCVPPESISMCRVFFPLCPFTLIVLMTIYSIDGYLGSQVFILKLCFPPKYVILSYLLLFSQDFN